MHRRIVIGIFTLVLRQFIIAAALVSAHGTELVQTTRETKQQSQSVRTDSARTDKIRIARSALRELQQDIEGILASRDFEHAQIGVSVISADRGDVLFRRNDTRMFVPASTLKLFTTATALDVLGKDFRFSTRLYLDGTTGSSGEFRGNLIVRGSGDPTWSASFGKDASSILDSWAAVLDSMGITGIRGSIVVDDTYFDAQRYGQGWMIDDLIFAYSAPVSALCAHDNVIDIHVTPGAAAGEPARIDVKPDAGAMWVRSSVTTVSRDEITDIRVQRSSAGVIDLFGSIMELPAAAVTAKTRVTTDATESTVLHVPVEQPAMYVGSLLRQALERRSIKVRGDVQMMSPSVQRKTYAELEPVCEAVSAPLTDVVKVTNTFSHNLCAENLLKTVAKESSSKGSVDAGSEAVKTYLESRGIPVDDFTMVDGSGLSRLNLCSPSQLTHLLSAMLKSPSRQEFISSLATPGEAGTMRNRTVGTVAEKSLRAKTGSMNNVSNIAGYVTTKDGDVLCFAIMINNYTVPDALARSLQDLVCMRLAAYSAR